MQNFWISINRPEDLHEWWHYLFVSQPAVCTFLGSLVISQAHRAHQNRQLCDLKWYETNWYLHTFNCSKEKYSIFNNPTERTKQCIFEIQMRLCGICEEKLALIWIGARVCHRNHATISVFQIVFEFIFKFSAPNGIASFARASWIASLNDESFDISVEQTSIVIVTGT